MEQKLKRWRELKPYPGRIYTSEEMAEYEQMCVELGMSSSTKETSIRKPGFSLFDRCSGRHRLIDLPLTDENLIRRYNSGPGKFTDLEKYRCERMNDYFQAVIEVWRILYELYGPEWDKEITNGVLTLDDHSGNRVRGHLGTREDQATT